MGQLATDAGSADKGGLASSLGAPLAVGGEVRPALTFHIAGSAAPSFRLLSPRRDVLDVRDGLLVGKSPGLAPVLVAVDGNTVVDFLHVTVRPVDHVEVHGLDETGSDLGPLGEPIELLVGESKRFSPRPYAGPERLIGVGASTWTVDPPVATVLRDGLPGRVRLVARQPGSATVTVSTFGVTASFKLKVVS